MADGQSKRILVIDDDDAFRRMVVRILDEYGFAVREAADFAAAMNALDGHEVDLLLTDILMPAGKPHGFSIAAAAQRRRCGLKVLYMTGTDDPEQFALFDPDAKVLHKPFTRDELRAAIAAVLG